MRWTRPGETAALRLAYCLNLHPADDLAGVLDGLRRVTLPLRERVAPGAKFGVGMYLGAELARHLAAPAGADDLARLRDFLVENDLDPFTFNAFPFGGFHEAGLKQAVFDPGWDDPARCAFTLDVARVAVALGSEAEFLSISTHTGFFAADAEERSQRESRSVRALLTAALGLARLEEETGRRIVLALEPEPGANCGRTYDLVRLHRLLQSAAASDHDDPEAAHAAHARHLGTCLDACHAAVEFESPWEAFGFARTGGAPVGKLQFTSALALKNPRDDEARERLLAMDEPRYLHQVRAVDGEERLEASDLPELREALADRRSPWWRAREWRCHFHVPVDLAAVGDTPALATTRTAADELLDLVAAPSTHLGVPERHVEIETYTWDVLPGPTRTPADLVTALEREYTHVTTRLQAAGWTPT